MSIINNHINYKFKRIVILTLNLELENIYIFSEFGDLSPELNSIFQVGCLSIFCGSIYGGVMSTKTTYIDFMQNNQATMFRDHLEAKVCIFSYLKYIF